MTRSSHANSLPVANVETAIVVDFLMKSAGMPQIQLLELLAVVQASVSPTTPAHLREVEVVLEIPALVHRHHHLEAVHHQAMLLGGRGDSLSSHPHL
mmetsp:Transcript_29155/g.61544  ORF Transcript_29155/g.61544 Transcript_29155/m.61544 type:complete len:97 (+) Transcript_29155:366-656(+)